MFPITEFARSTLPLILNRMGNLSVASSPYDYFALGQTIFSTGTARGLSLVTNTYFVTED